MDCSKLLIKNVWMAEGSAAPLRRCCVLTGGGHILAVEPSITDSAADRVLAPGREMILAPGFIDVHGHSDIALLAAPEGAGKIAQGVTTEIAGNCGLSAFPLNENNRGHLQQLYRNYGVELTWSSYSGWKRALAARGVRLRVEALAGHNTLRAAVAGYETAELSGAQLEETGRLLDAVLAEGAVGLSAGLLYVPGKFAPPEELVFLMKRLAGAGKIFATHLRSEGERLLESLDETFDAASRAGLKRIQISHLKTAGAANWRKLDAAFDRIGAARASGMTVHFDRYPYVESMTQLSVIVPEGWDDLSDIELEEKLALPENAGALENALAAARPAEYWQTVRLVGSSAPGMRDRSGMTFDRIAALENTTPAALTVQLLQCDAAGTTAAFCGMNEENLRRITADAHCCCGSDENARPFNDSIGRGHPRAYGSFPKILRLLLDSGAAPEEAVRRVSGLPAEIFGLHDRGRIEPGKLADFALFDPETVDSRADFRNPARPPEGIAFTVIGGGVYEHGEITEFHNLKP